MGDLESVPAEEEECDGAEQDDAGNREDHVLLLEGGDGDGVTESATIVTKSNR